MNLINPSGPIPSVSLSPEATERVGLLLGRSSVLRVINSPETLAFASAQIKELTSFLSAVEKSRKEALKPAKDYTAAVNSAAKDAVLDVEKERERLQLSILAYEELQAKKREQLMEEKAAMVDSFVASESPEEELNIALQDMRIAGTEVQGVKDVLDYEVTNEYELAYRHPNLVTITPKREEILKLIRSENPPQINGIRIITAKKVGRTIIKP